MLPNACDCVVVAVFVFDSLAVEGKLLSIPLKFMVPMSKLSFFEMEMVVELAVRCGNDHRWGSQISKHYLIGSFHLFLFDMFYHLNHSDEVIVVGLEFRVVVE